MSSLALRYIISTHATLLAIETAVPVTFLSQKAFIPKMKALHGLEEEKGRLLSKIALQSQIEKRHTVIDDYLDGLQGDFFGRSEKPKFPSTQVRNQLYKIHAPKLAYEACQKTITAWGGNPEAITHIISISCTGMMAPGIEFLLIEKLGLSPHIERLGINFMGCFGAFKGIRIAKALALENPAHRILVVCTELCSLHLQEELTYETIIGNSLFADGAAALLIGCHPTSFEKTLFEINSSTCHALGNSQDAMSWEIGESGYRMRLTAEVPSLIRDNIVSFVKRLLGESLSIEEITWAVHPGGKAILEAIAKVFTLDSELFAPSWKVLQEYGNMSSPTFLFVLKEILAIPQTKPWVMGLGFGPGLSMEGLLIKRTDPYVAA